MLLRLLFFLQKLHVSYYKLHVWPVSGAFLWLGANAMHKHASVTLESRS